MKTKNNETWKKIEEYENNMLKEEKEPIAVINIHYDYCEKAIEGVYVNITRNEAIKHFNDNKTIIIVGSDYPLGIERILDKDSSYSICYKCKEFDSLSCYEADYLTYSDHNCNENGLDYYIYDGDYIYEENLTFEEDLT